jgi:hypothetical protein
MGVVKFSTITFSAIKAEVERFLRSEHRKAGILFSPASPYGQILSVVENIYQLSILYLKNSINQFDLSLPNSQNPRIIRNYAILAGHIPTRVISASGTLRLTLKTNSNIDLDIPGGRITIPNKTQLRNITNSLDYCVNLGKDSVTYKITPNYSFFLPIIQGRWKTVTFTGTGENLQTFSISDISVEEIENFNVEVFVNGELWELKKHIWEMIPEQKACVARTGFNGGLDIVFGNEGFGSVPPLASVIDVNYILSDGSRGNIFRRTRNDWRFVGDIIDGNGDIIDLGNIFDVDMFTDINFGAEAEDIDFTRNILPVASNNFVLALPQQYAYHIKRLGVFSHVNAYEKTGTIFIVATPNVRLFKNQNADYFTIDKRAFELDRYEKSKIDKYLKESGTIQLTRKYRIDSPNLSYYIINIYVIPYADATDESVDAQILDTISEYFLDLKRIDRIPKLDIIRELSKIDDIHSVDIQFISKKNEDYHRENLTIVKNKIKNFDTKYNNDISIKKSENYNENLVIGIDPVLGDILFEPDELPIIRGGWYDRNGIFYSNDMDGNSLKSVNIIRKSKIDPRNRTNR